MGQEQRVPMRIFHGQKNGPRRGERGELGLEDLQRSPLGPWEDGVDGE